jgi:tetratricopeptide (TPR) repeat protein
MDGALSPWRERRQHVRGGGYHQEKYIGQISAWNEEWVGLGFGANGWAKRENRGLSPVIFFPLGALMRFPIFTLLVTCVLLFSGPTITHAKESAQEQLATIHNEINLLKFGQKTATESIEILRRDQINYQIEKDLLKSAYSSNLETINLVLAIFLGIGGVMGWLLGYFGIKNLRTIKTEFETELSTLASLRTTLESEIKESKEKLQELEHKFANSQKEIDTKLGILNNTNEDQSRRLQVLELIEKVGSILNQKNWRWALEHISVGLNLDPNNLLLLKAKSHCHGKLGEFQQAINTSRKIIELEPVEDNDVQLANMLEYLALSNQLSEFEKTYAQHKDQIDRLYEGNAILYFRTILELIMGNLPAAIRELKNKATQMQGMKATKLLGDAWSVEELSLVTAKLPEGTQKKLLDLTASFFTGAASSDEVLSFINANS